MEKAKNFMAPYLGRNEFGILPRQISKKKEFKGARVFEDGMEVCTRDNRENCYDPTSILQAFRPLGVYAKIFGLFPRYDLSFVNNLQENKIKLIHILDYMYSFTIMCLLAGGALMCTLKTPQAVKRLQHHADHSNQAQMTDFYVSMAVVYCTMVMGVMSLFTFPTSNGALLKFLDHFVHLDKIMRFDGRADERIFVRKIIAINGIIFILSLCGYSGFYIMEPDGRGLTLCSSDYLMAPIMTLAGTTMLIPTSIVIFFMHAIRLRLFHFNKLIEEKLKDVTPSYSACSGFSDYGKELDGRLGEKMEDLLAIHLEKLRLLQTELSTLACELGVILGGHLVRDVLFSIVGLILYTFILIWVDYGDSVSNYVIVSMLDIYLVLKLIVMSTVAHRISCLGHKGRRMLNKVSLQRVSPECTVQIQMFLNALDHPIQISAAGYIYINRQLITSIVGAIATFFIILIQFKVGDVSTDLQEVAKACANHTLHSEIAF